MTASSCSFGGEGERDVRKPDVAGLRCRPFFFQVNYPFSVHAGEAARGQPPHSRAAILAHEYFSVRGR